MYLHELLHCAYKGQTWNIHPHDLNELDKDFWQKTDFGKKLAKAYRDIFGHEHPVKQRVLFPTKPSSRITVSPCFSGVKRRL